MYARSVLLFPPLLAATLGACTATGRRDDVIRPRLSIAGIKAADYYPLAPGWTWTYSVTQAGATTRARYFVIEGRADSAVVQEGDERVSYAVTPEGIAERDGDGLGDYVIKDPIAWHAEWPVAGGRALIASVDGRYTSPLVGNYEGCVLVAVTREDPKRMTQTLFAPYLGPILRTIQVRDGEQWLTIAQARLVAFTRPGGG